MNKSLLSKFTPEVLAGIQSLGFSSRAIAKRLRSTSAKVAELETGLSTLNMRQAGELERFTEKSIGELAVLGIARHASSSKRSEHSKMLRDTLAMFAKSRNTSGVANSKRRSIAKSRAA